MRILSWLDTHIFRHRWAALCNYVWDWQLARDDFEWMLGEE